MLVPLVYRYIQSNYFRSLYCALSLFYLTLSNIGGGFRMYGFESENVLVSNFFEFFFIRCFRFGYEIICWYDNPLYIPKTLILCNQNRKISSLKRLGTFPEIKNISNDWNLLSNVQMPLHFIHKSPSIALLSLR